MRVWGGRRFSDVDIPGVSVLHRVASRCVRKPEQNVPEVSEVECVSFAKGSEVAHIDFSACPVETASGTSPCIAALSFSCTQAQEEVGTARQSMPQPSCSERSSEI